MDESRGQELIGETGAREKVQEELERRLKS